MKLIVPAGVFGDSEPWVDRDGFMCGIGEGFDIDFGGFTIHFESEVDAAKLAVAVLERLGWGGLQEKLTQFQGGS